jgi:NAD+ diphosphatase
MRGKKSFLSAVTPPVEQTEPAWWFVFRGDTLLVSVKGAAASLPYVVHLAELNLTPIREHYLGMLDGRHCYSAELDEDAEAPEAMTFHGLRQLWGLLDEDLIAVSGHAFQIVNWDRTNQFCGRCGTHMESETERRAKVCPQCGLTSFPPLSPAIIVAVVRGNKLLLASAHRHPPGLYSVIAGFVEPGETLKDCVRREVKEETGIEVKDIRYFGSQPWPFPHSLMIAFTATYAGSEIIIEKDEIKDAGWFTADNLPPIPPKISIARQLIDWFVTQQSDRQ